MKVYVAGLVLLFASVPTAVANDSTVLIEYQKGADKGAGTGTVIACEGDKSLILTCAHVVPTDDTVFVTHKGKRYEAKWIAGSPVKEAKAPDGTTFHYVDGVDLALITVEVKLPVAPIATTPFKKGDKVFQYGYAGGPPFADKGPYAKIGTVYDAEGVWATADARPGDSGSGLFNDKGQLAAVTHSRSADRDEPGLLAVPLNDVRTFVKEKAVGFPQLVKSLTK